MNRRKLALHVNPSPLAYETPEDVTNPVDCEDKLAVKTGQQLPSTTDKEHTEAEISIIPEVNNETINLTEQPLIIDSLTGRDSKETENVLSKEEINLPQVKDFIMYINLYFLSLVLRSNGLTIFIFGKVNCHVIHLLNHMKTLLYQFSINYKDNLFS
jgi:hypothetical protein